MRNHWIQEKRKRDQSTKYSVQFFCLDIFGNAQHLCSVPLSNNIRWTAPYETDIDGFYVIGRGMIIYKEEFTRVHLNKGDEIVLGNSVSKLGLLGLP